MTQLKTLLYQEGDKTYAFLNAGDLIEHPAMASRGQVSPALYGFEIIDTGGGCTAWRQDFVLEDGRKVFMLLTQELSHELDVEEPVEIGVYIENPEDGDECLAFWTIDLDWTIRKFGE
jgi:hypothetical protein